MKKGLETLFARYIIDGTVMESTPADMLGECGLVPDAPDCCPPAVVDETADRDPAPLKYDISLLDTYLSAMLAVLSSDTGAAAVRHQVSLVHPFSSARLLLARTLLKFMWRKNGVKMEDLSLSMSLMWDPEPVGHMAALHSAIESVTGYAYELGLGIMELDYNGVLCPAGKGGLRQDDASDSAVTEGADPQDGPEGEKTPPKGCHEMNFRVIGAEEYGSHISRTIVDSPGSMLIYVPFDTCSHKLGGSLFASVLGGGDENGPEISDPDYFIDSFEVVHDLVEDGVALSGVSVGRGGLMVAVDRILGEDYCIDLEINGIQRAYMEDDKLRILFSEIPGALIQIPECEGGYVDSQFLLQDIAYYDLGSPYKCAGKAGRHGKKITLSKGNRADLSRILSALINGQPEDPDLSNFSEGDEDRGSLEE